MDDIVTQFQLDMINAYQSCIREVHYNPTLVGQHLTEYGAVETARWLVNLPGDTSGNTAGFTKLWEAHRHDLTAEALILKPQYASLFSVEDRRKAYDALKEYEYAFPPEIKRP